MKTNSVPKIRFKGFTDDWEQRKAGEIFKSVSDKGYTDLPVLSASQELGMILRDEIGIDIKYDESSIKNYKRVKPGQFVIHLRSFQGGFSWSDIEGITSPAYTILDYQEPEEHCSKFWKIVLTSPMFITRLETVTYGIRDGRSISFTDFSTLNLNVPSIAEQQKIGEYFSKLDNLITLHQRKCEQTKELKKFMLQKMFPKKGEKNPEIRFPGFTDDWEQRKLEKHIIEYHEVTTENNQYPVLTSSRKGIFLQTDYYSGNQVASADNTGYNIVPYGYFTYRHMSDDEIFHFNINDIVENGIVSTLYPVFTTDEKLDSRYLQYQLNYGSEFARFAVLQKQGGSRTYMYLNKLKKLSLTMPTSIDEQKKISSFLMSLDNLITLHQRKCEQLKELKKFMLQNMFPKKG